MKKFTFIVLLFSSSVFASKTQVTTNSFTLNGGSAAGVLEEPSINLINSASGRVITQVAVEWTNMGNTPGTNPTAYLECTVMFKRFLNRAVAGPGTDKFWVISPFITAGAPVGGTVSVRRTYLFNGTLNTGTYANVSCQQHGSKENIYPRYEIVSTVEEDVVPTPTATPVTIPEPSTRPRIGGPAVTTPVVVPPPSVRPRTGGPAVPAFPAR